MPALSKSLVRRDIGNFIPINHQTIEKLTMPIPKGQGSSRLQVAGRRNSPKVAAPEPPLATPLLDSRVRICSTQGRALQRVQLLARGFLARRATLQMACSPPRGLTFGSLGTSAGTRPGLLPLLYKPNTLAICVTSAQTQMGMGI